MRRLGVAVGVLAVALVGAGTLDALDPAPEREPPAVRAAPSGGTWACPVGSVGRGGGYVFVANAGAAESSVRVTLVPDRGRPAVLPIVVPPGAARIVPIHARTRLPVGAIVEYAGGDIVAFHSVAFNEERLGRGAAATACGRPGPAEVVLPAARTLGTDTVLALLNAGSGDAVVNVRLLTEGRVLEPERLSRRVVPARRRLLIRLGDFAFDKRDVSAIVRMESGRVVAEGLLLGAVVTLVPARVPAPRVVVLAAASGPGATVSVTSAGEDPTDLVSRFLAGREQGRAPGMPPQLDGLATRVARIADPGGRGGPVAYALEAAAGSPIVAGARWRHVSAAGAETADATGEAPARRWVGVMPAYTQASSVRLLVANAEDAPARLRVRLLGERGPQELPRRTVGAGRLRAQVLASRPGIYGVEVVSDTPVVAALYGLGRGSFPQAFAATAVPLPPARATSVEFDPRLGVPAPLETP